jgi:hypothetical protein
MSTTVAPSKPASPLRTQRSKRALPAPITRPALRTLAILVVLAALGLGIALAAGATVVFNVLVWLLFTVLWLAVLVILAFSPATLDQVWRSLRRRPLVAQAVTWLLFLPIMLGLWIWKRAWPSTIRLVLLLAIAAWNVFLFFPRG